MNFTFIHSGILWLLPLAGLPVLLHLLGLMRARPIPFSDLTLLRSVYRMTAARLKLREWALLAARCGALTLLILAFSRPVAHLGAGALGPGAAQAEDAVDLAVLLDRSYSMGHSSGGRSRFERAKEAGLAALGALRPQDRVAVGTFAEGLEGKLDWASGLEEAGEAIRRQTLSHLTTDAKGGLEAAYSLLAGSKAGRRAILLLSDGAAHAFRSLDLANLRRDIPAFDPAVTLLGLDWEDSPSNAYVADLRPSPEGSQAPSSEGPGAGAETWTARVRLEGGPARRAWPVELWRREAKTEERRVDLQPGQEASVAGSFPPEPSSSGAGPGRPAPLRGTDVLGDAALTPSGTSPRTAVPRDVSGAPPRAAAEHWGRVELRRDGLPADDVFHFAFSREPPPRLLCAYGDPAFLSVGRGGYFLKQVLGTSGRSLLEFGCRFADLGALREARLEDYDAVLLADFRSIPEELGRKLSAFVRSGGGLWVVPHPQAEAKGYEGLRAVLPARLAGAVVDGPSAGIRLRLNKAVLPDTTDWKFRWEEFELEKVRVRKFHALLPREDAQTWLETEDGRALLMAGSYGRGRAVLWSSTLDMGWTNLPLKPLFAPWLNLVLGHAAGYAGRSRWNVIELGGVFQMDLPSSPEAGVRVRRPDGREVLAPVRKGRLGFSQTDLPGVYTVRSGVRLEASFAVNLNRTRQEGDLSPPARPPWKPLRVRAASEEFRQALYGKEVRTAALGLVLLLLFAELILSWRK